ncbi:MAG: argininosuccinate lyase [Candidatus Omnitrophica bacterium]|nr:argininosuccinate lyase [Candidatus Omnitrophota bacterium]
MAKKLWGGRFDKKTDPLVEEFTSSISYDKKLACFDIKGSIAHAKMLGKCKIITKKESAILVKGLESIGKKIGKVKLNSKAEDIHTAIANLLRSKVGKVADKLHTARSRNDQVVLDVKMYTKDAIDNLICLITSLQKAIIKFANKNSKIIIPAYTHLQVAQCVLLSHHLLAYVEMLARDKERLSDTKKRTDFMPLGSCALSGTGLHIDREYVKNNLGFSRLTENSIDAVSDRDFILELLSNLVIISIHLSRMAEDLILWATKEFNFIDIDFSFCTGSSIMPHKKNPDVLELIRASVGKVGGDFSSVLILMKGLPLTYNRDLQLDKPPLFNSTETINNILQVFTELFKNIKINKTVIAEKVRDESLFSVDIVEYLIEKGSSYRQAHDITGKMVKDTLDKGRKISDLTLKELKKYSGKFEKSVKSILNAWASVSRKTSSGGTGPRGVKRQIAKWSKRLNA